MWLRSAPTSASFAGRSPVVAASCHDCKSWDGFSCRLRAAFAEAVRRNRAKRKRSAVKGSGRRSQSTLFFPFAPLAMSGAKESSVEPKIFAAACFRATPGLVWLRLRRRRHCTVLPCFVTSSDTNTDLACFHVRAKRSLTCIKSRTHTEQSYSSCILACSM